MPDSLIGQVVGGCRIERELGKGGMSTIYLATQESIGREVALKMLSAVLMADSTFMERFTREVETTSRLQHPHIIPIYDYGQHEGQPYIVMAYIAGGSLERLLLHGPLPLDVTARTIGQVAEALGFAHGQGVIHRDVKPANILLDAQQNAILTDFGIARVVAETEHLTRDDIVGTPTHLAPEMLDPNNAITTAADIYGLGVTLYQMLAGKLPFLADTAPQMMWAHVNEAVPLLADTRDDVPPELDVVIQRALAKAPAARYASAGELAADLAAVAAGRAPAIAHAVQTLPGSLGHPLHAPDIQQAIQQALDQVVKIVRPDGSTGSGIYLPGDRVVTCLHVVNGSPGVYVTFHSGEQIEADPVATDHHLDLALLKLRSTPTTLARGQLDGILLHSNPVEPGQILAAIGHPLGLDWSVTGGHYNALRNPGEEPLPRFGIALDAPLVQVDVVINAGNSGGPIIDAEGHLVGLADSIINPAIANNIGFAIEGKAVLDFWQAHQQDIAPLVAYSCGHHHAEGQTYCPLTGKPARKLDHIPMPTAEAVRYSCGHVHPPGLSYCPLTGKPVEELDEPPEEIPGSALPTAAAPLVTCTNCGYKYPGTLAECPQCGKPGRR